MVKDTSDYTRFYSKEDVAKARAEAEKLLRENPNFNNSGSLDSGMDRVDSSDSVQSDEDYEENGPRCFNPSPEQQRRMIYERNLTKKNSFWNYFFRRTTALVGLLGGAFFTSTKLTGNVTGMSTQTSSIIGVVLLIIGIIAGYFWLRNKKRSKEVVVSVHVKKKSKSKKNRK